MALRWSALLLIACGSPPATVEPEPSVAPEPTTGPEPATIAEASPPTTTLWIGGDVLLSEAIRDYATSFDDPAEGMARVLAPTARHWQRDPGAFVLVNLELPVPDRRRFALDSEPTNPNGYTAVHLHGPSWLLPALARSGVDAVMLANNHAFDQEREGLAETIVNAKEAGLLVTGAGAYPRHRWPLVLGPEDHEVAVIALYDGRGRRFAEQGDATISHLDEASFDLVAQAAEDHPTVVVVVHVIGELVREPEDAWRAWAHRLVQAGADAIVVHGTHVVMPVERIDGVPVAWGLGNLVSDMGRLASPARHDDPDLPKARSPWVRETLLARLAITDGEVDLRFLAAWMSDDRYVRWHAPLPGDDLIEMELLPLRGCEPVVDLPEWPEPYRGEVAAWIAQRRERILRATHLAIDSCDGNTSWLRPRW